MARRERAPGEAEVKVFVDTAPVMEKPLAAAAGLGWQGKHTNLVSREFGSWLFLGAIFTDLALPPDAPESDHCGACRACLDVCPTRAFSAPYRLDARRCVSYLTIEHKGHDRAANSARAIGNRIYGCDDCLAVCPWNKFAREGREAKLAAREDLAAPPLAELAALDEPGFRRRFAGGPIKRIGHARFLRNVMIAIGNSGDPALIGAARAQARGAVAAGARDGGLGARPPLLGRGVFCPGDAYAEAERDAAVVWEWRGAPRRPAEALEPRAERAISVVTRGTASVRSGASRRFSASVRARISCLSFSISSLSWSFLRFSSWSFKSSADGCASSEAIAISID